jgi:hypothetical protein
MYIIARKSNFFILSGNLLFKIKLKNKYPGVLIADSIADSVLFYFKQDLLKFLPVHRVF